MSDGIVVDEVAVSPSTEMTDGYHMAQHTSNTPCEEAMAECSTVEVPPNPSPSEAISNAKQLHHEAETTLHYASESDSKACEEAMVECNTVKVSLTPSPTEAKSDPEQLHHEAGPTLHESCESDGKDSCDDTTTPTDVQHQRSCNGGDTRQRAVYDVIVIGAGIAGLAAARVLSLESRAHVLVLEARNRPGGRIHSVRLPPIGESLRKSKAANPASLNHDDLSIFHSRTHQSTDTSPNEAAAASTLLSTSDDQQVQSECTNGGGDSSVETTAVPLVVDDDNDVDSSPLPGTPSRQSADSTGPLDVDLGANYLIGCSNLQEQQPLFHLAKLLHIPTVPAVGDLCRKYRGWECVEMSTWRDHLSANGGEEVPMEQVAEAVFLFDKVVHLMVHNYFKRFPKTTKHNGRSRRTKPKCSGGSSSSSCSNESLSDVSVKNLFTESLEAILYAESRFGLRPTETFRDPTEKGVFDSIVARYLGYVNPLHRLPLSVLDDLCEVANPRWSTGLNGSKIHVAESDFKGLSLADQLALGYPSHEQREAYYLWADRKFRTLRTSQPAGCGVVAKAVAVKWEDRLVTGRFGDVLTPLLQDVAVQYQTVVRHIEWRNGVRVHVAKQRRVGEFGNDPDDDVRDRDHHRSNEQEVYEAKHCIVAVPVGVLKGLHPLSAITFDPPLPEAKRAAIDRLAAPTVGAATHDKIVLRFRVPDDVFWDAEAAHLKCPDPRLHILNLHRYGKPGVLCAHIWGGSGLPLAEMTDEAAVDVILDLLDRMYFTATTDTAATVANDSSSEEAPVSKRRRTIPEPVAYLVTRWSEDPFSLGAYTTGEESSTNADRLAYAVGLTDLDAPDDAPGVEDDYKRAKSKIPRLLFAGEGTLTGNEAKECTHGALQTGISKALVLLPYLTSSATSQTSPVNSSMDIDSATEAAVSPAPTMDDPKFLKIAHYLMGTNRRCGRRSRLPVNNQGGETPIVDRPTRRSSGRLIATATTTTSAQIGSLKQDDPYIYDRLPYRTVDKSGVYGDDSFDYDTVMEAVSKRGRGRPRGSVVGIGPLVRIGHRGKRRNSFQSMTRASFGSVVGAKRGRPSLSLCRRVDDLRRYWLNAPESDRHEAFAMLTTFVDEARAGVFVADEGSCFFPPPEDVDEFPPDSVSSSDDPHVSVQIGRTSTEPPSVGSVPEHEEADKTASSRDSATFAIWSKVVRRPAARSNADDVISSSPQLEEKQAVEQPPTQKTSNLSCISSNSYDPDDKGIPPQTVPESLVDDVPISDQTDHHDGDDMRPSTVQSIDSHDEHHPDDIPFTANQLVPMGI